MILFLNDGKVSEQEGIDTLRKLRENIGKEEVTAVNMTGVVDWYKTHRALEEANALVLACNVSMGGIPADILRFLETVEQAVIEGESIPGKFYAILYTDLYEGEQTSVAMGILKSFCCHANITWGRGLGIGGSNMAAVKKPSFFPLFCNKSKARAAVNHLSVPIIEHALYIREHMQGLDHFISPQGVSKDRYMRRVNYYAKKNHRIKIAHD
ncbi:MAG: hypothetical protein HFJ07_13160 [Lachnospiraceae bacterium]|jgi:multimeric flavodoxin WrbA|nr:hypothetical protein [Lachnospiraceae bacterium]